MDRYRRKNRGVRLRLYAAIGLVTLLPMLIMHVYNSSKAHRTEKWMEPQWMETLQVLMKKGVSSSSSVVDDDSLIDRSDSAVVEHMSDLKVGLSIHSVLENIEVKCPLTMNFGHLDDGDWEICDDTRVRPRRQCIVYSFTINNDFSFDDQIAKFYGCHVYRFDPTNNTTNRSYNRSSRVHIYNGISHFIKHGKLAKTVSQVREMLGHQGQVIDIMKMDRASVEWWNLYRDIGTMGVENVRQLVLGVKVTSLPGETVSKHTRQRLLMLQWMHAKGFHLFHSKKNSYCKVPVKKLEEFPFVKTLCYDVSYMHVSRVSHHGE